jgi:hypothetical protein
MRLILDVVWILLAALGAIAVLSAVRLWWVRR